MISRTARCAAIALALGIGTGGAWAQGAEDEAEDEKAKEANAATTEDGNGEGATTEGQATTEEQLAPEATATREMTPAAVAARELPHDVVDPTASLMQLRFQAHWTPEFHDLDGDEWDLVFRPTLPFEAWGLNNVLRLTLPYHLDTPFDSEGLGNTRVSDLVTFNQGWGRWAVGASANFRPDSGLDDDGFQIGPAGGAVMRSGRWMYGGVVESFFSGDTQELIVEPVAAFMLNDWFSINTGDWEVLVDLDDGVVRSVPISVSADVIFKAGDQPMRLYVNPQYNPVSESGSFEWLVIAGLGVIVPGVIPGT